MDELSTSVERRFEAVDRRFERVDRRFDGLEAAIVEQRQYAELGFSQLDKKIDAGFARSEDRFARLERKLDQYIDTQIRTNELVDRRLRALEPPWGP